MRKGEQRRSLESRTPVYIGDELSAAGYRLAGAHVHTPSDEQLLASFRRALKETELLLIDVNFARRLPETELRQAVLAMRPLVLIVPDMVQQTPMRDLEQRLRRELGVHL